MVVGLVRMDKGEIHLDDLDLSDLAMHERARKGIGYLPQEASIFRKLTISENIMAILETRKDLNKQQRQQRLNELLADFKITHIKDSLGMSVSGGERRRAEIARALAADPKFMLLDEPFAGVDPIAVIDIQEVISYLKTKGIGILITDHNVRETLNIVDRAYILNQGEILIEGDSQTIANSDIGERNLNETQLSSQNTVPSGEIPLENAIDDSVSETNLESKPKVYSKIDESTSIVKSAPLLRPSNTDITIESDLTLD